MTLTLRLLPCDYREGMVYVTFRQPAIAESRDVPVKTAKQLQVLIDGFVAPFVGKVNAKLFLSVAGRKVAGFDAVKHTPVELHAEPAIS